MLPLLLGLALAAPPATRCFSSGAKVAAVHRAGPPVVAVVAVVDTGAADESASERGAAHLVEHLWFGAKLDGVTVQDRLAALGADANAATELDTTTYTTIVRTESLPEALRLERARLEDPLAGLAASDVASEQDIVSAELAERFAGRQPVMTALVRGLVDAEHPYRRSVGGSEAEVRSLNKDSLRAYAARTYKPAAISLLIIGDLEPAAALDSAQTALGPKLGTPTPCPPAREGLRDAVPDFDRVAWTSVPAAVSEPMASVAWSFPPGPIAAARVRRVLPLLQRAAASCTVLELEQLGVLACLSPSEPDSAEAAIAPVVKRAAELGSLGRDGHLMTRVLLHTLGTGQLPPEPLASDSTELLDLARRFARSGAVVLEDAADNEEVARWVGEWTRPERALGATLVPEEASGVVRLAHSGRTASTRSLAPGPATAETLARAFPDPGFAAASESAGHIAVPHDAASNVTLRAIFRAPTALELGERLLAWEQYRPFPELLLEPRDRKQLSEDRVRFELQVSGPYWSLTAEGQDPQDVVRALELATTPARVDPAYRDALGAHLHAQAKQELTPALQADQIRWEALHGQTDPRRSLPEPLADPTQVAAAILEPAQVRLVAVVPPEQLADTRSALESAFPKAETKPAAESAQAPPERSTTRLRGGPYRSLAQVDLQCWLGEAPPSVHQVTQVWLAGGLNHSLRHRQSLAYGVDVQIDRGERGPLLHLTLQTSPEAVQDVIDELHAALSPATIHPAALDPAKWAVAQTQAFAQPAILLDHLEQLAIANAPLRPLAEDVAAVDRDAVARVLAPCAGHEVVTVLQPGKASRPPGPPR